MLDFLEKNVIIGAYISTIFVDSGLIRYNTSVNIKKIKNINNSVYFNIDGFDCDGDGKGDDALEDDVNGDDDVLDDDVNGDDLNHDVDEVNGDDDGLDDDGLDDALIACDENGNVNGEADVDNIVEVEPDGFTLVDGISLTFGIIDDVVLFAIIYI